MPEGHTLHRLAGSHQRDFAGGPVEVSSPQGRFAAEAGLLDGHVFRAARAHGKHLFHDYGPVGTVHIHLGLYGSFTAHEKPVTEPVGKVRMRLVGESCWADLRGPIRCELVTTAEVAEIVGRLGPDPLRDDADPEKAWNRITRSRTALAALLLDQTVLAGVGNVYRAEVLFRHGVPPLLPGSAVTPETWQALWTDLVELMGEGVRSGRIDTVREEHAPETTGRAPRRDRHGGEVYVYRRAGAPCLVCATPVEHRKLANRHLYWCPYCQAG